MAPHRPAISAAPQPTKIFFDPYNSSSTGHQTAKNRLSGSTSWRDSRTHKLAHQLKDVSGRGGEQHISDSIGAGSDQYGKDGRKDNGDWEIDAPGLREKGWQDISRWIGRESDSGTATENEAHEKSLSIREETAVNDGQKDGVVQHQQLPSGEIKERTEPSAASSPSAILPQIFRGLTIYLNGSTAPLISDHKLKQLFAQHGGNASIALGRRTVTHVILGDNCGGGLASSKIQKELRTIRGKGIKFVNASWVLDSIERGIRQPEGLYLPSGIGARLAGSGQTSVKLMFQPRVAERRR